MARAVGNAVSRSLAGAPCVMVARQWRDLPVAGRDRESGSMSRGWRSRDRPTAWTNGGGRSPGAARHARVSYRFEYAVLPCVRSMTQTRLRQSSCICPGPRLSLTQLHRSIERIPSWSSMCGEFCVIGIDEVSYHKRPQVRDSAWIYDLERSVSL